MRSIGAENFLAWLANTNDGWLRSEHIAPGRRILAMGWFDILRGGQHAPDLYHCRNSHYYGYSRRGRRVFGQSKFYAARRGCAYLNAPRCPSDDEGCKGS